MATWDRPKPRLDKRDRSGVADDYLRLRTVRIPHQVDDRSVTKRVAYEDPDGGGNQLNRESIQQICVGNAVRGFATRGIPNLWSGQPPGQSERLALPTP